MKHTKNTKICNGGEIMFVVNKLYSRRDIYNILDVPEDKQGGNWNTGYTQYDDQYYVFVNIDAAGRTGHNYHNNWDDNLLYWQGKQASSLHNETIQRLLDRRTKVHIFTRTDSSNVLFTYQGLGIAEKYEDTTPVTIYWSFMNDEIFYCGDEVDIDEKFNEGSVKCIIVNAYERNAKAREACIKYHGCKCAVCDIEFEDKYGEIGKDFVHVHHLKQLSEIKSEYIVDPIED